MIVTPADVQDRAQVVEWAAAVQEATGQAAEVAFVDQGYTGERAEAAAAAQGIRLARNYERLETTLAGFHYVAFALLALAKIMSVLAVL